MKKRIAKTKMSIFIEQEECECPQEDSCTSIECRRLSIVIDRKHYGKEYDYAAQHILKLGQALKRKVRELEKYEKRMEFWTND